MHLWQIIEKKQANKKKAKTDARLQMMLQKFNLDFVAAQGSVTC